VRWQLLYNRGLMACIFLTSFGVSMVYADSAFDAEIPVDDEGNVPFRFVHKAMGTDFVFDIYMREGDVGYDDLAPLAEEAFELVDALEQEISSWIKTSDTSQINAFGAKEPVPVRQGVYDLLEFSRKVHRETDGIFDITVGPLIELWKIPLAEGTVPDAKELTKVLNRVDMNKVKIDPDGKKVSFAVEGMRISFGGIGKGLALDRAAEYLIKEGVKSALLAGGNSSMVGIGAPPGKEFWNIGIHNPYNDGMSLETVRLRNQALSTSACYHHLAGVTGEPCGIFDPLTGQTATDLLSATVVAQTGMQTDALSTSFYVMGIDEVAKYCKTHPEVSAILVPNPNDSKPKPVYINMDK